jgi:tetratricopeptide (TPR) repeat protein
MDLSSCSSGSGFLLYLAGPMRNWYSLIFLFVLGCGSEPAQDRSPQWALIFDSAWATTDINLQTKLRTSLAREAGKSPFGFYCRAWILAKAGKTPKALKTIDSLLLGFPGFVQGYYLRANLRAEVRDTAGALEDFDKAILRKPDFFEAYVNRGSLHFAHHHPELALLDFRQAQKIQPNSAQVLLNMGHSQWALGQPDSACLAWSKSAKHGNAIADTLVRKWCIPSQNRP